MKMVKTRTFYSIFADHLDSFIKSKRQKGCQFKNEAGILSSFDRYLNEISYYGALTQDLAMNFATIKVGLSKNQIVRRYRVIQQFSVYLSTHIPDTYPIPASKKTMDKKPHSVFACYIANFIEMRKRLGYRFENQAAILIHFDRYLCETEYQGVLTEDLAMNFATYKSGLSKNQCARRYQVVRQFSEYLAAFMPDTIPLRPDLVKQIRGHSPAHIYTDEEMTLLMNGARSVSRKNPLRGITLHTMIGLAASTGMRISEIVNLDREDVDLKTGVLTVRRTKFQKDRLVPVHNTTIKVLRDYALLRDTAFPSPATPAFFINKWHNRFSKSTLQMLFHRVVCEVGVRKDCGPGPRFHDLRHTFAVSRLVDWYREGKDVQALLPLLATYMGHVHYSSTAYYLMATAELLGLAAEKYEAFLKKESK